MLVCLKNTNTILKKQVVKMEDNWKHIMTVMLPQEQLTPLNSIISLAEVIRFKLQDVLTLD